jgi:Carboxypeptidase regulatory-like domain/TonB-dependent Receptor Plug Domain/TonB dependent receptor
MHSIRKFFRKFTPWMLAVVLCWSAPSVSFADASSASLSITVSDTSGAFIPDAKAVLRNNDTNQEQQSVSSKTGSASFPFLKPGHYVLTVSRDGFSDVTVGAIVLNVGDNKHLQLVLTVGSASQNVTVDGSGATINTTDGSVSTVIERQFVANIPLNGNSFQDLISMTPGVVTATPQTQATGPGSNGDFSINGQRTESNYYMVDGVSANVSAGASTQGLSYGATGNVAATSALGTTQSLLSVDDLQEFRVESSSYSAEFGRSPGGQLTFVTRSGTDTYHGSAYDHFRNGWFDANDWFNDELGQRKEELHQNDFGGTFGGPVLIPHLYQGKGKTFFFGSYEGLRLVEPNAASVQYVPDLYLREQAPAVLQPLLNAFPLPTPGGIDYGTSQAPNLAEFFQGYSLPGKIDSSSIRIDQTFTPAFSAFFRFADTPSSVQSRDLSDLTTSAMNVQTYTLGTTYALSQSITNQFRLGYSRSSSGSTSDDVDSFGGAVPTDLGKAMGNTNGVTGQTAEAELAILISGSGETVLETPCQNSQQQQWNVTDTFDIVHGAQQWKFGIDFRQISTELALDPFVPVAEYLSTQSILSNSATVAEYQKYLPSTPVYKQFALFAQDNWRINTRLSLSGGLRWELAPPPRNATNPQPYTALGDLSNPSSLSLAPDGTPLWHASLGNLAPRLGIAWQANTLKNWATVIRGGGGVFFDTNNETALSAFQAFGFNAIGKYDSAPMPFTTAQQDISVSVAPPYTDLDVFPPHLQLPYTLEWNTAFEQELGQNNIATVSYLGSAGRRLSASQALDLSTIKPSFDEIYYVLGVTSDYDALQAKFQRNVSKGVNALVSYTWSHSIDFGSNSGALMVTRGNSDFDVRQSFQGGLTWELPHLQSSGLTSGLLNGWAFDGRLIARTAFPVTLKGNFETDPATGTDYYTNVNLVPNEPIYLYGSQFPGGRSLNPAAFAYPTGTNQGNAPRNFARGFGESQVNFAARRDFPFSERVHLQLRAEAFNILNHPNFGYVDPNLNDSTFGQATQMLNQSLGTVASQYQQGGPRSMQFALRLAF